MLLIIEENITETGRQTFLQHNLAIMRFPPAGRSPAARSAVMDSVEPGRSAAVAGEMYADVSAASPYVTLNSRRSHNLETERADSAGRPAGCPACLPLQNGGGEPILGLPLMKGNKPCHAAIRPNSCRPISLRRSL